MKISIIVLLVFLFLSGCMKPSDEMIRKAIAETELASIYTEEAKATITPTYTLSPTLTLTPKPTNTRMPTYTPIPPEALQKTKQARTQQAIMAKKTEIASYKEIDWRKLTTYTDQYIGESFHIWGKVFNVNSDREMQIWISRSDEAVYIYSLNTFSDIFEGDIVDVYGIVGEKYCGKNTFGGEVCQPLIGAKFVEKR